ncbi:MAG: NAD-dependent epimerase/dehydratase family protein [Proteobacteria bacterium]|nr:NAD-dependent epimerase/dehydratase family protein [Pseudomonadota bacterium]
MTPRRYLVTGATGFVGKSLAQALRRAGHTVVALTRREDAQLAAAGIEQVRGELGGDLTALPHALQGVEACFHVAAKVGMWGSAAEFERVNVDGTRAMLAACEAAGVQRFIYTSSPSVVANGSNLCNVDETQPYPPHFEAHYPRTKAAAEMLVLAAHNANGLRTVALRPHLIFGPGDTNLIPTIVAKGRSGKLKQIGSGQNLADFSFIDDCVLAHIAADGALERDPASGGRPYFISQGEPYPLWRFINQVLEAHGVPPVRRRVPQGVATLAAGVAEWVAHLRGSEPLLTRFLVSEMATDHYFSIEAARRLLGYAPRYTVEQGLQRTLQGLPPTKAATNAS